MYKSNKPYEQLFPRTAHQPHLGPYSSSRKVHTVSLKYEASSCSKAIYRIFVLTDLGCSKEKNIASVVFRSSYIVKIFTNNSSHHRSSPGNVPKTSEQLFVRTLSKFINLFFLRQQKSNNTFNNFLKPRRRNFVVSATKMRIIIIVYLLLTLYLKLVKKFTQLCKKFTV